jgi:hypothetical protein
MRVPGVEFVRRFLLHVPPPRASCASANPAASDQLLKMDIPLDDALRGAMEVPPSEEDDDGSGEEGKADGPTRRRKG